MIGSIPRAESGTIGFEKSGKKGKIRQKIQSKAKRLLIDKGWIFYLTGFLLGRAVILSAVSPFAVAFIATIWLVHRDKSLKSMIAVFLGALSYHFEHAMFIALAFLVFILIGSLTKNMKNQQLVLPVVVFLSTILSRIFFYSLSNTVTSYEWALLAIEGVLGAVLVIIFMQSIPLLSPKRYKPALKNEEIVCLIILIASVLTGFIGWQIYGASVEQIFSRYFVLIFSFIGGAAIGSTVGVVAGLILSLANVANLYQMSLLAFSGLLGGLLKEGKKLGTAIGLLVGTCLIGIYGNSVALVPSLMESCIAIGLFLLTPASWFNHIARYIPGTEAYTNEQEQYLQKVRNVTAKRVEQFSDVFRALSKSFSVTDPTVNDEQQEARRDTDYFLSQVTEKTCQGCFMKDRCWQKEFDQTYSLMEEMKEDVTSGKDPNRKVMRKFENHCVKSRKVVDAMKEEMSFYEANHKLRQQVTESKRLVADQLQGVSDVMEDFAKEIVKERQHHELQEAQVIAALKHIGIELTRLDIYQLEKGDVDIELTASFGEYRGEGEKLIAPILSDILHEIIVVKQEDISPFPHGYSHFTFGSAKEFAIETGAANAAKGGGLVSGDSFTTIELGAGKFAMAISDGMGNGKRAREESMETLRLLQQILQSGIKEKVAIKSINSILSLRTTEEMFATLDLAVIDLHDAYAQFVKIGSTPSFIRRGANMFKIEASNLPIGIIKEFDVEIVKEQLLPDDLLIMMSDGIFDGPQHVENIDIWLKRKIKEMDTDDPQEIADLLLEEVIRTRSGEIIDDMTVLVAKVKKNTPQWTSIPIYESNVL
ncbi:MULTISPECIES: stage II sporulation protein E [Oceanobacillus]|uniref:Stage II sporulation protein E n=1 Tax=Oceanobacillus kimchii TaxID=746691 RepID=A0ABQ5TFC9_9BACI|nr:MULTISPECIES: stage II sporulation protein E [Oceanobacillus]MBT2599826.1 stage II sporulation protein E [Oceanobacillus sp. ISL-74]MBT2652724.1 stage II sporulation protein E [Oceanobacillus sp. ISL-73]MCT1577267.1 stage II sporulation protein E [Oceanobacillus kimchii]MCT2135337.1 stage II sporulation protein E [Oceanobacillus kimchii]OEH56600.1 stage II sporulation protein E [Oceanobacillus sp. E9]